MLCSSFSVFRCGGPLCSGIQGPQDSVLLPCTAADSSLLHLICTMRVEGSQKNGFTQITTLPIDSSDLEHSSAPVDHEQTRASYGTFPAPQKLRSDLTTRSRPPYLIPCERGSLSLPPNAPHRKHHVNSETSLQCPSCLDY